MMTSILGHRSLIDTIIVRMVKNTSIKGCETEESTNEGQIMKRRNRGEIIQPVYKIDTRN